MKVKSSTTVADINHTVHQDFARNQAANDPNLIQDASLVTPHAAMAATSSSFISHTEKFHGIDESPSTFSSFDPPPNYHSTSNRFFGSRLFHSKLTPDAEVEILRTKIVPHCNEREGKTLGKLARELEEKNDWMNEVNARIRAMQKS